MTEERDFWQQIRDSIAATVDELDELEKHRPLTIFEAELRWGLAAALATYDKAKEREGE